MCYDLSLKELLNYLLLIPRGIIVVQVLLIHQQSKYMPVVYPSAANSTEMVRRLIGHLGSNYEAGHPIIDARYLIRSSLKAHT